ncbi:MAG TPA: TonB-dependent receptor [Chlorobaculum sp.]|nr:TonB-dependent receptor [Chlorobaculum sp.]
MNRKKLAILMAAMLCSKGLQAEEASTGYIGPEVVVTSSRFGELKKSVTTNITVINKERIAQSPAKDLGELLAELSVGYIHKYPGTTTAVGIRGFRSDEHGHDLMGKVLVLLDGRRVATGNLAKIATENVERIEIIRGPAAVQYGSAAIGGIVNVITARGNAAPAFSLEQKIGTYAYKQTTATSSGKVGNLDYSGSFSISEMGDYKTGDGKKFQNTGYHDLKRGSLNLGYEFLPGHRIGMVYNHFQTGKIGSPGYLSQNDLDDYTVQKNRSVDFIYEGATTDRRFSWMARYYTGQDRYTEYDPVASNPDNSFYEDGLPYVNNVDYKGTQGQVTFKDGGLKLTAGADWLKYDLESTSDPTTSSYENPAGFILGSYRLFGDRLVITGGLRYDDYKVNLPVGIGTSQSTDNVARHAGAAWNINDSFKLRTSYGEGFRIPEALQLASDYISTWGTHYVGNPNLKPESSKTCEAGIDMNYHGLNGSVTLFKTDFKNKIQTATVSGNSTWVNIGGATVSGLETGLSWTMNPFGSEWALSPFINYTYLTDYSDNATGEQLLYTPEWSAAAGFTVHDQHGFKGMFNLAYTGKTNVQVWEDWSGRVVTKAGFPVASVSFSKKVFLGHEKDHGPGVTFSAEVNNLFDRNYEYVRGYPMPGRTFTAGIKADI